MPVKTTSTKKKTIDALFSTTIKQKASDLHLVVGRKPYLRVDGELVPIAKYAPLTGKLVRDLVYQILHPEQKERFEKDRGLDFAYTTSGARFRVNVHFEKNQVGLAARLITVKIPTVAELTLPAVVEDLVKLPHGLILVTGPTGSGKSTTLATMINVINQERAENIITLEDPIEFLFPEGKSLIRQRQLGDDMPSFASGLRRVLRQDPDVIMVGEMRDLETIAATLTLAETGHLVFATLHTYSAATTIERIIDVFPPYQQPQIKLQLASVLRAVMVQQLLPKLGGGRIAAREVMLKVPAVANLIREDKANQIPTVIQTSGKLGMYTMEQDLRRLINDKLISQETAAELSVKPQEQRVRRS